MCLPASLSARLLVRLSNCLCVVARFVRVFLFVCLFIPLPLAQCSFCASLCAWLCFVMRLFLALNLFALLPSLFLFFFLCPYFLSFTLHHLFCVSFTLYCSSVVFALVWIACVCCLLFFSFSWACWLLCPVLRQFVFLPLCRSVRLHLCSFVALFVCLVVCLFV